MVGQRTLSRCCGGSVRVDRCSGSGGPHVVSLTLALSNLSLAAAVPCGKVREREHMFSTLERECRVGAWCA